MHQGHNIPWGIIQSKFKFIHDQKRFHRIGFYPRVPGDNSMQTALRHFIKKFVKTLTEFSESERAKYPRRIPPIYKGKLFSDALLNKHPLYLNKRNQRVESWISDSPYYAGVYNLQPVANILLYENQMETLLMLAQHPQIDMLGGIYRQQEFYHGYGFYRTKELSLDMYMFYSTAEAVGALETGAYAYDRWYCERVSIDLMPDMEGRASEQAVHNDFMRDIGAKFVLGLEMTIVHHNQERFEEYLKDLFALLYRYDVLARECGIQPDWERDLADRYPFYGHA